jgi:excisionase family DNA binding protein
MTKEMSGSELLAQALQETADQQEEDIQPGDLMTTGQVASLLGLSVYTVKGWTKKGFLNPIKLPTGQYRYRRSEVLAILQGRPAISE